MQRLIANRYAAVAAIALIVAVLPFIVPSTFYLRIATLVFIFALAVLGLNLLMGFAGQVSLGHAGFFGIGAYAVAVGPTHLGIPSWAAVFAGAALAGLLAFAVGRPILKLKGHYLAVATLGLGLLIGMVFTNEARWTGGPDGMPVARLVLFGWTARGTVTWYWISGVTLALGALIAVNLIASPTGRAFRAIHDSETAATVLGVDVARYKLIVFVLSAVYAAVAGAYLALFDGARHAGHRGLPALDRVRHHGGARRPRLDPRQRGRRGAAGGAAAGADRVPRLRAHRARNHHDRVHDLPARRHRAEPRRP